MQRDHRGGEVRNERPALIRGQYEGGYRFQGRRAVKSARFERIRERGVMSRAERGRGRKF